MKDLSAIAIESINDFLRTQHDYYKHLTTLNTGSILIIIAFVEKIFKDPISYSIYAVPVSIAAFIVSLIYSLMMMTQIHGHQLDLFEVYTEIMKLINVVNFENLQEQYERAIEKLKKLEMERAKRKKEINRMFRICHVSFVFGILFLVVFVVINFIFG